MPTSNSDKLQWRKVRDLPPNYAVVEDFTLPPKPMTCRPAPDSTLKELEGNSQYAEERPWLERTMNDNSCVRWPTHHAEAESPLEKYKSKIVLLPVFYEVAHTTSMMLHSMNVVKRAVAHVNPMQTTVLVADQQLYSILKQIQFRFPDTHGENIFCVLMGGLHIELATLRALGHFLEGSGWVHALVEAQVTTPGRGDSMITASHLSRTRYCHEVSFV